MPNRLRKLSRKYSASRKQALNFLHAGLSFEAGSRSPLPAPYQARPKPAVSSGPGRIDDTTARKLRKGRLEIDGRIDLHGMNEFEAHERLYRFLLNEKASGSRLVLVITGKGARSGGILRNAVPRWLGEANFRPLVNGCRQAHLSHGGEGALYVRIRRTRPGEAR
ncbi:MAG: Smr/MutS family protein [Nitratireductor sp.]